MNSNIKYPIAIARADNTLKHISEVSSGDIVYCFHCKEDMVAINNPNIKIAPHFRHKPDSNCNAKFESFIHWLAKEVLSKKLKTIHLPEINTKDLHSHSNEKSDILKKLFSKHRVHNELKRDFFKTYVVQPITEIKNENHSIEKIFKTTEGGSIKVDFVIEHKTTPLFIEPFYTNPISEDKLRKIKMLDVTTIAINLSSFGIRSDYDFNLQNFIKYIKSPESKTWTYLRKKKIEKLLNEYEKSLEKDIISNLDRIEECNQVFKEIEKLQKSMEPLQSQISSIRSKITEKKSVINSILKKDWMKNNSHTKPKNPSIS